MAVMSRVEFHGGTTAQYDRVNEILGINGEDDAPDGLIQHVCGITEDGIIVIDVWDAPEAMMRFAEERLGAALREVEAPEAMPEITHVHNMIPKGGGEIPNVIMMIDFPAPPEVYDNMHAAMPSHAKSPEEGPWVSHVAAVKEDGTMLIVDLWGSQEAFERFAQEEIAPVAGDNAGAIAPRFIPVHNAIVGRATVEA